MSVYSPSGNPAARFILDRLDLLLGRLEQLGRHIRDAVARVIGTTVGEAVSEATQAILKFLPHRKTATPRYEEWRDDDTRDPYGADYEGVEDPYAEQPRIYSPDRPTSWNWRRTLKTVFDFLSFPIVRVKSWSVARWAILGGAAVVSWVFPDQANEAPIPPPV